MTRGCGIFLWPPSRVPGPQGQQHKSLPHFTHTAEQEGALLERTLALWAGPRDVSPGVTTQGTWHCHLQQHLGLDESQGKGQACWQLRGVSQPLSSPSSALSPHMGCKARMAKRFNRQENLQAHGAGREV